MIKIFTILATCAVLAGCSVEVISDKEAIERLHAEEAKVVLADAEKMAELFSNTPVNPAKTEVKVPNYNEHPIFVSHAKRLVDQGLPYDSSLLFTTQAYEEALAIQASYKKRNSAPQSHTDEHDDHGH
ncbi:MULTISPECIES: hypothetical protein [Acinetobacter]|uniref:Lipoprotein n=1 Tax=Acinetobacter indicus TaxID=756892 RepID=A0A6C0Y6H1_9GAMM|nr:MULTISPECIES: hypothetical protein [Acinetobacter]QIC71729.1 hypothetical protein FSC09_15150 [Acinetobacter indicus]QKQ71637.1 hypothetical protein E5Y90_15515 [Acinetobacter sp. 10FS3-1]